jgi:hypothetical protein
MWRQYLVGWSARYIASSNLKDEGSDYGDQVQDGDSARVVFQQNHYNNNYYGDQGDMMSRPELL